MGLKLKLYELLVNRKKLIKTKYEAYVAAQGGKGGIKTWLYLLRLNFGYYILHDRSTEIKKPKRKTELVPAESELYNSITAEELAQKLSGYDVISFDIFDTLIFRNVEKPTDVFYFIGQALGYPNYKKLRRDAEKQSRELKHAECGSYEVDIYDIARRLSALTGLDEQRMIDEELITEKKLCFANPYMKRVWELLLKMGKKPVILSDMYLPATLMEQLLVSCGYSGWDKLYISCDTKCSKFDGSAYKMLKEKHPAARYAHVGDNLSSDIEKAKAAGIDAYLSKNPADGTAKLRAEEMSPVIGSLWAGIINSHLHYPQRHADKYYELGYIYGGLLVYGYCSFIDRYAKDKNIDKIFFLARDGYIVKEIYDKYFGNFQTEYIYWSRTAGSVISAEFFPWDFVEKYILQNVSSSDIIEIIADKAGLLPLIKDSGVDMSKPLDVSAANKLSEVIYSNRQRLLDCFKEEKAAAGTYIRDKLGDARRILTVDCGWAGSGHFSLSALIKQICPEAVTYGAVCGTNNAYHAESDTADVQLADDSLRSYCFSSAFNRSIYESHSPKLGHNLYFEMLLSSEEGSLLRFEQKGEKAIPILSDNPNSEYVRRIHDGIRAFAEDYHGIGYGFADLISGNDAYAPFKTAAADKRYFGYFNEYIHEEHTLRRR